MDFGHEIHNRKPFQSSVFIQPFTTYPPTSSPNTLSGTIIRNELHAEPAHTQMQNKTGNTMNTKALWIVGYRDFGFEVAEIAEDSGYEVVGFIDYNPNENRTDTRDAKSVPIEKLDSQTSGYFLCAMTSTVKRRQLVEQISQLTCNSLAPISIEHSSAVISKAAELANGTLIMPGVVIASGANLDAFTLVNRGATIGHHTSLGAFSTVGPGVNIGGNCEIGENVYFGIGSTVINRVKIGSNSLIGAGAVVVNDIPSNCVVKGVPAKISQDQFPGH